MTGKGTRRKHPIFALEPASPGAPRIGVEWLDRGHAMAQSGPHGHQFLAVTYFERSGGSQRIGSRAWEVGEGDVFLIAPGETHEAGAR